MLKKIRNYILFTKSFFSKLKIINKDILKINPNQLAVKNSYKIISNLPYSVASRIIIMFAESNNSPISMTLTIQKEVAERLTASPNSKSYGVLSILVSNFYEIKILKYKSKMFFPSPKVLSSVIFFKKKKYAFS